MPSPNCASVVTVVNLNVTTVQGTGAYAKHANLLVNITIVKIYIYDGSFFSSTYEMFIAARA